MKSDRNSLVMESSAGAPEGSEPAASGAGGAMKPEEGADENQALLGRLLAMAQRYRSEGNLRQAIELYWTLAQGYPRTPQSDAAHRVLLEIADAYERQGARHMARSMYERLL
jgi:tetratricopeptide (TPR) repeat protein